jgi:hypothetical protein
MDDQPPDVAETVAGSDLREQPAAASPNVLAPRRPRLTLTLTPRQRLRRLAVAGSAVLLALLILIAAVPGLGAGAGSWLASFVPKPTATLPPGTDRFYFIASIPDIQLSLDGHLVSLPRIGTDPPLVLARGPHRLAWQAAPFLPQSCLLSVPFGLNDTCGTPIPVPVPLLRRASVMASLVLLRESLATLSASHQRAVIAAIQHALLTSTSDIEPGDHYALAQVATQPLRGTLEYQLDTSIAFGTGDVCALASQAPNVPPYVTCTPNSAACGVCTIPAPVLASAGAAVAPSSWYVFTFASLSYTISTLGGQTLIANGPISQGGLAEPVFNLLLALTWDGTAWHAQPFLGSAYAALLQRLNASAAFSTPLFYPSKLADMSCAAMPDFFSSNSPPHTLTAMFLGATNPSDGCLAIQPVPSGAGTQTAYYLYRFGGLVAVNDVAQRQQSLWPPASAHERQLAAAILSSGTPWP